MLSIYYSAIYTNCIYSLGKNVNIINCRKYESVSLSHMISIVTG